MTSIYAKYKNWNYKNTFFLIVSFVLFLYFLNTNFGKSIIYSITNLGYVGILFAGIFFVSIFTVAPATLVLLRFAQIYDPVLIAIISGVGAVIGDYLIFRFFRDNLIEELKPVFRKFGIYRIFNFLQKRYFSWILPVLGAIIIASPLPDEIGVGLMGLSKLKNWQFLIISFILNSIGIFSILKLVNFL